MYIHTLCIYYYYAHYPPNPSYLTAYVSVLFTVDVNAKGAGGMVSWCGSHTHTHAHTQHTHTHTHTHTYTHTTHTQHTHTHTQHTHTLIESGPMWDFVLQLEMNVQLCIELIQFVYKLLSRIHMYVYVSEKVL